ncbi:MAG: type II secretion system F family protein [Candidatus Wallbacteria bacterium]|nr:type II secretion system F family protein [Candidatus Wallbacteria bacterium]
MNPLWLIGIGIVVAAVFMFWPSGQKRAMQKRLNMLATQDGKKVIATAAELELQKSFKERVILPILHSFTKKSAKKTNRAKKEKLRMELAQAGNPFGLSAEEFMALRTVLTLLFMFIGLLICFLLRQPMINFVMAGMISVILAMLMPNFYIKKQITFRKGMIQRKLPDVLDLLTVSVEAGLGFDSAMNKVVEKFEGPLADEFKVVLNEVKLGKKRRDALKDMANKMEVDDLSNFISSLIQAETLGVSLGNVLRIQSAQARQRRRQRAEEAAMKAPIKMLLPMVGCIFPCIFVIIGTPIVIGVYEAAVKNKMKP